MIDYSSVTEVAGELISQEAAAMMRERYQFVAERTAGQDVLEVSCGAGHGLGFTAHSARSVVGTDITYRSLAVARDHYRGRIPLLQCDAQALPFRGGMFDAVAIHEAIYYYPDLQTAFTEAVRVLRPGGRLFISTINPGWSDFNPSPFAVAHLHAQELRDGLSRQFPKVELFGAFPVGESGIRGHLLSLVKRTAVGLGLIPKTMKGKRLLKRLAYGQLVRVPSEIPAGGAGTVLLQALDPAEKTAPGFKVLYAIAYHS